MAILGELLQREDDPNAYDVKAEMNADTSSTINSQVSWPIPPPKRGRIAVKVINHLGDEIMKVCRVE